MTILNELRSLNEQLEQTMEVARHQLIGKRIRILSGKYKGREGFVYEISIFGSEVRVCAPPFNLKNPDEYLFADSESRQYRSLNEIEVLDDDKFYGPEFLRKHLKC